MFKATFVMLLMFVYSSLGRASEAVGFYSHGLIKNAKPLPIEVPGLLQVFPSSQRGWGTEEIIDLLTAAGQFNIVKWPEHERLQIAHISAEEGGKIPGHTSHQNGLDVDIVYLRTTPYEQKVDAPGLEESFVTTNDGVTPNFDLKRNWDLIKFFVSSGQINRIFVDVAVKKALCNFTSTIGERTSGEVALRVLRPLPKHHNHMHVRLYCPNNSQQCENQDPPPEGDGC